jgi:hypothetical protein
MTDTFHVSWLNDANGVFGRAISAVSNTVNGLGLANNIAVNYQPRLTLDEAYELFINPLINTACTAYPVDSLRQCPEWQFEEDTDLGTEIKQRLDEIVFYDIAGFKHYGLNAIKKALIIANVEGNCHIVLDIDDGKELSEPVDLESVKGVRSGAIFGRDRISYNRGYYGKDPHYTAMMDDLKPGYFSYVPEIHPDRVLRFYGVELTGEMLYRNDFKDRSVIEVLIDSFSDMTLTSKAASNYLQSASGFWYKMDGLADMVLQGKQKDIQTRLELFKVGLSSINLMVLDAAREDAGFINRSFSGIDSLVNLVIDMFVACSRITRSRLLGSTKQGAMSESGKSDHEQWAEMVANYQSDIITPYLCRLTDLIMPSITGDRLAYEIAYPSILVKSDRDRADEYKIYAEADAQYASLGLPAKTILKSRFGGSQFGVNITLDEDDMTEIEAAMGETETETESPVLEDSDKLSRIGSSYDLPLSDSDYESILRLLEAGQDLED